MDKDKSMDELESEIAADVANFEQNAAGRELAKAASDRILKVALLWKKQKEMCTRLEAELKDAKAKLAQTEKHDLPELMAEYNYKHVQFEDGSSVEIVEQLAASIKKNDDEGEAAFTWLEENDFGGLIKTKVAVEFGKGEYERAKELSTALVSLSYIPSVDRSVHASTFKAFAREQTEKGETLPQTLFTIYTFPQAKIHLK